MLGPVICAHIIIGSHLGYKMEFEIAVDSYLGTKYKYKCCGGAQLGA